MKVKHLITVLSRMPKDAEVWHLWDGALRTKIEHVWVSKNGDIVTADTYMVCYSTEDLPKEIVQEEYWRTPGKPMIINNKLQKNKYLRKMWRKKTSTRDSKRKRGVYKYWDISHFN